MSNKARWDARTHSAVFFLCLTLAGCAFSRAGVTQTVPSVELDSLLIRIAAVTAEGAAHTAGVWPGYGVPTEYIMCRPEGQTLAVLESSPPAEFGTPLGILPSKGRKANSYFFSQPLPELGFVCFHLEYPVGARQVVAVPVLESVYSVADPLIASVVILYHEDFHAFQGRYFAPTSGGDDYHPHEEPKLPLEIIRSAEFQRLAAVERALLRDALAITDSASLLPLLRTYLTARGERMQLLPSQLRSAEPHSERKEGSANLVGYQAAYLATRGSAEQVAELVRADLLATPVFDGEDYMSNGYRQWHIYATGAAIGLLLDRMHIPWREKMQSGSTFEGLLRDAVPLVHP